MCITEVLLLAVCELNVNYHSNGEKGQFLDSFYSNS